MTNPLSPAEDAAVRAGLAAQAASVQGDPAAAGIYGDPAGASAPPQPLNLGAASATNVDTQALLDRINALEAAREADRVAALPPDPGPPDLTPVVNSGSSEVRSALLGLHARLLLIEEKLGL